MLSFVSAGCIKSIRSLRSLLFQYGPILWIGYRLLQGNTNDTSTQSVPEILLDLVRSCQQRWPESVLLPLPLDDYQTSLHALLTSPPIQAFVDFMVLLVLDLFGLYGVWGVWRAMYYLYTVQWSTELRPQLEDGLYEWAKQNVGFVQQYLEQETVKITPAAIQAYGKDQFADTTRLALPAQGLERHVVLQQLRDSATQEHASSWKPGKLSGAVYTADETHMQFLNSVYACYSFANALHAGAWPKLSQCETELVTMCSHMLHGTGIGCSTSGGTESILLAIKAHWVYYGKQRHIVQPELICASTAHAAVDKACEMYGIRKVVVQCTPPGYTLDPNRVERYITANTIMIYASAPNYPQGTIDPIEKLGELAQRYDIGLHVDSCLGGFVLAFAKPGVYPLFDFQVKGVTSMSIDTHKYGYAPKGTSVVLYRTAALRHAQYFSYGRWTGGIYATPTLAGSRASALVACAWASMVTIGRQGYEARVQQILQASQLIADGIRKEIPQLQVLSQPNQTPTMVVCFTSSVLNCYRVADVMKAQSGWQLNTLQHPASVHICVTLPIVPRAQEFVNDLKQAVQVVEQEPKSSDGSKGGSAGMYGMTGSLPEGPVNDFLKAFLDVGLTAQRTSAPR